jgi:ubiquinol-cytochrome c reductase cytochrome c subunit
VTARRTRLLVPVAVLLAAGGISTGLSAGVSLSSAYATGPAGQEATPWPTRPPTPSPTAAFPNGQTKVPPAVPTPTSTASALVDRGRLLYGGGCAGCHGQGAQGTQQAPSLLGKGGADIDFWVSTGRMPLNHPEPYPKRRQPVYDRSDIDALIAYVTSLSPGGVPVPATQPGNLQDGLSLYTSNCASCHGGALAGYAMPGGDYAPNLRGVNATQIAEAIRLGPGYMPAFPQSSLSDAQVDAIATYVTTLPKLDARGGEPLGSIGPVTEGAVGFVAVGLLLLGIRLLGSKAPKPSPSTELESPMRTEPSEGAE